MNDVGRYMLLLVLIELAYLYIMVNLKYMCLEISVIVVQVFDSVILLKKLFLLPMFLPFA